MSIKWAKNRNITFPWKKLSYHEKMCILWKKNYLNNSHSYVPVVDLVESICWLYFNNFYLLISCYFVITHWRKHNRSWTYILTFYHSLYKFTTTEEEISLKLWRYVLILRESEINVFGRKSRYVKCMTTCLC